MALEIKLDLNEADGSIRVVTGISMFEGQKSKRQLRGGKRYSIARNPTP